MSGLFITFEGPEGSGKTTQIKRVQAYLMEQQISCLDLREPGGTEIGDSIRNILLDPVYSKMKLQTETLLYAASRAQLVGEVIEPALAKGDIVLCDRYIDSSIVYQGYASLSSVRDVMKVNQIATRGLIPFRTYLLDISLEVLEERISKRGKAKDRIEQKDMEFHKRVRQGYLALAKAEPERFRVIDAVKDPACVLGDILEDLVPFINRSNMFLV